MKRFKVDTRNYKIMPKFTNELNREGVNFKTIGSGGLTIEVNESDLEKFILLCRQNNITIYPLK
ncbi:hypothetical protein N2W37_000762 [Clostridium perfringens]|uniref:hypothetical protein n=1 Tax=Clostridium perfringens TaxID=1502 RepID=UPI0024BCAA6B|nr:hypothetical protein [Clostridium perfringens]EGT0690169.1 hypothetical protein [Clostridium perfringens]EJT5921729.1 hypothetical protein [Clostridium perfringens]ELC8409629.1 hypothetical protein [Clostridium perfringens]MDM0714628.1 hypothetical protein [Clostridium perfringens]MDU6311265.1 hypothetical protein [Clostridium perfringens]